MESAAFHWPALAPLLPAAIGVLACLLPATVSHAARAAAVRRRASDAAAWLAGAALAGTAVLAGGAFLGGDTVGLRPARPLLQFGPFAHFVIAVLSLFSIVVVAMMQRAAREDGAKHDGHCTGYALLLLALIGMSLWIAAADLLTVFLGIELASFSLYALVGLERGSFREREAALRFLLAGGVSSALLLYGSALLYGATGDTHFEILRTQLDAGPLATLGLGLFTAALVMRSSAVPFQQWMERAEGGASLEVAAFLSAVFKFALFAGLLHFVSSALPPGQVALREMFALLAALTLIVGHVMMLRQGDMRRRLFWVGVAQSGFLLMAFAAPGAQVRQALLYYLVAWGVATLGLFYVLSLLGREGRLTDAAFRGLARERPALALATAMFLLSLAGFPGLAGFIAKFGLLFAVFSAGQAPLAALGLLTSAVAMLFTLRFVLSMYVEEPARPAPAPTGTGRVRAGSALLLFALCALLLWLGLLPAAPWLNALGWFQAAAESLTSDLYFTP